MGETDWRIGFNYTHENSVRLVRRSSADTGRSKDRGGVMPVMIMIVGLGVMVLADDEDLVGLGAIVFVAGVALFAARL